MLLPKIKYGFILWLVLCGLQAMAQIEFNRPLVLEGDSAHKQHVDGLAFPADSSYMVNTESVMAGYLQYYTIGSVAGDTIRLTHDIAFAPEIGTRLNFVLPANNTGRLFIQVNNGPALELLKEVNRPLGNGDLKAAQMISMVYNASHYQLLNPVKKNCPPDFTEVNAHLCIQTNEFLPGTANFFNANASCQNAGYRLCSWGEWYYACQKAGLGLGAMTNNYEWIDSGGNSTLLGVNVGFNDCQAAAFVNASATMRRFRCCYSK